MRCLVIIYGLGHLKPRQLKASVFYRVEKNKKRFIIKFMLNNFTVRVINSLSGLLHTSQALLLRASAH